MDVPKKHLIYLTGFMGSGKSTIAPILANTLGYAHVDVDEEIERLTGKQISDIFSELGEEYFREVEYTILRELSLKDGCVISLGGGTVTNEPNLQLVKSSGILIYLKVDSEQIIHRLKYKTDRPLLKSNSGIMLDEEELRSRIIILLEKRERFYSQADITVMSDDLRVGVTVDKIVDGLRKFDR
ncbi:MAG: shikimate kinase [Ignavibacteria bacterium]|nr:shikimate kinase [Ignavibacteria bacterium]MBI3766383.1 shikimate kinase [Ignavibacteriales bacterium]